MEPAENDFAGDWLAMLSEQTDLSFIEAAFDAVIANGDAYIEKDLGCEAVIAAETVASLLGRPGARSPDTQRLVLWVAEKGFNVPNALRLKALEAIVRVRKDPSEMVECWMETPDAENWLASMDDLAARLASPR